MLCGSDRPAGDARGHDLPPGQEVSAARSPMPGKPSPLRRAWSETPKRLLSSPTVQWPSSHANKKRTSSAHANGVPRAKSAGSDARQVILDAEKWLHREAIRQTTEVEQTNRNVMWALALVFPCCP